MLKLISLSILLITLNATAQKGSKEKIYSSFTIVNDGLENTRMKLSKEINKLYFDLIKMKGEDTSSIRIADSIRVKSNELIDYINHVKVLIIIKTEKIDKKATVENDTIISLKYLEHFDDYYTPGETLLGEDQWQPIKGKYTALDLKIKLKNFNKYIHKECFNSEQFKSYVDLENSSYYGNWEVENFFEKPLAGILTYLSKLQLDILLTEQQSIKHLSLLKSE